MPLHFCLRSGVRLSLTKSIKRLLLWGRVHDQLRFFEAAPPPSGDEGTTGVVPGKGFQMQATSASFGVRSEAEAELPEEPCSKYLQPPSRKALSLATTYDATFKSFSRESPPLSWTPGRVTPGIRKFNFSSPQKRGWQQACSESPPPQSVHPLRTFQNGGDSYAERFVKKRRLYGQDRPQGCLFHRASLAEPPKVSEVCLEGNDVRVCLPTLWAGKCSQSLHKTYETCSGRVTTTGHQTYSLFRFIK